ncbi:MAG: TerB N-terminal domain-containing protein [Ruminococcus sp.]|jgi:hypothetical protein|nr:TerB N-terminal domain-containing protein [Ruminococcus sp.]
MKNIKKDYEYPIEDDFFSTITIPGFEAYTLEGETDTALGVYELAKRSDFITAAKSAEKLTDSFDGEVPLTSANPRFSAITLPQFRRYLTLRENFRIGRYECTYVSYIYLYINEIINLIGIDTYEKGASELASILSETAHRFPNLTSDCKRFLRDFYVVYNIPEHFSDFVKNLGVENFFPDAELPESEDMRIAVLYNNAEFRIPKTDGFFSAFYSAESFLRTAFFAAVKNLDPLFAAEGNPLKTLGETYFGKKKNYTPFSGAVFMRTPTRGGAAVISNAESFEVTPVNISRIACEIPKSAAIFFGYVLCLIEQEMRTLCGYKYALNLDRDKFLLRLDNAFDENALFFADLVHNSALYSIIHETVYALFSQSDRFVMKNGFKPPISKTSESLKNQFTGEPYNIFKKMKAFTNSRFGSTYSAERLAFESDYLWNLSDYYPDCVFHTPSFKSFSDLGFDTLRAYFTVRTLVRARDLTKTTPIFWNVYISELINSKKLSREEVFAAICEILLTGDDAIDFPALRRVLVEYFVVFMSDDFDFLTLVNKNGADELFPDIIESKKYDFFYLSSYSDYKPTRSKFYDEYTQYVYRKLTPKLFSAVSEYFAKREFDFDDFLQVKHYDMFYGLFQNVIAPDFEMPNKNVYLTDNFVYGLGGYRVSVEKIGVENHVMPIVLGIIFKNAEITMRKLSKFKGKITVSPNTPEKLKKGITVKFRYEHSRSKATKLLLSKWKCFADIAASDEFAEFICRKTAEICAETLPLPGKKEKPAPPVKINIDFEKLGEIREDSEKIAARLGAVYEELDPAPPEIAVYEDKNKQFLSFLLDGKKAEAEALARANGLMFEVIAEQINELFAEKIGDIVIENGEIIPDYKEDIIVYLKSH